MHIFCVEKLQFHVTFCILEYKPYQSHVTKLDQTSLTFISQKSSTKKQF